ncbi:hypothetical protein HDU87_006045 [Geranomyces variabilis]|uniref:Replication termination factor 2 n=1 Tax=Geranomyces variabilis TaxID=109894 RepID=A0AAD5TQ93_9FUNG|nr:hypothetical protein HDU87_006045 [Geranomyces variabilis]
MGCDGGSIPKRGELVKVKQAKERADPRVQLVVAWFFCQLSKQPLVQPVVADMLGRLYNKDAVLEYLLRKSGYGDGDLICKHITSFKDVTTLNLAPNPLFTEKDSEIPSATVLGNIDERPLVSRFVCPVTGREMNGKSRFAYLLTCGCVFSGEALRNVPTSTCLSCNKPYTSDDVIPINPTQPEEIQALTDLMNFAKERRAEEAERKKAAKKAAKKSSKNAVAGTDNGSAPADNDVPGFRASSSDEEKAAATAIGKKRKKSKKQKDADSDDDDNEVPAKRKSAVANNINMALPDLNDRSQLPLGMREHSDAIKSLYKKSDPSEKEPNFLVRGTFNRFAAGF